MRFPSQEDWSGLPFPPPLIEVTCKKINYKMMPRRHNRIFEIGDVGETNELAQGWGSEERL